MRIKRKIAAVASAAMLAAVAAVPMSAGAAEESYSLITATVSKETAFADASGTPLSADITTASPLKFRKILDIQNEANIPDCTFTFKAASGTPADATDTTLAVLAGPDPDKIVWNKSTVENGAFVSSHTNAEASDSISVTYKANEITLGSGDTAAGAVMSVIDDVVLTEGSPTTYCAEKEVELDFSGCGFTEPGVYRYILTEEGSVERGVKNDPDKRTLDVYVGDASYYTLDGTAYTLHKKLNILGYTMYVNELTAGPSNKLEETEGTPRIVENYTETKTPNGIEVTGATKTIGFKNQYPTYTLTFGKEVKGNQGSKDKYFKFTVALSNAPAGKYDVILANASAAVENNSATKSEYIGQENPRSITVGESGSVSTDFYLHDGQYIKIVGIAKNTAYTITEEKEDYTQTEKIAKADSSLDWNNKEGNEGFDALNDDLSGTFDAEDLYTGFTNTRSGLIPTGILVSVAGPAVIGIIALLGIAVLLIRGRRRKAEED
ncbi:MAG: FctA domain-containing protein [Ruminococcus sp.]|nr:FctA domain-containing protein [Ruminococcus sp.]